MQNFGFNTLLKTRPFLLGLILSAAVSCKDITEPDLSGERVVLLAPADSLRIGTNIVQFKWDKLDNALYYRLQVVRPSFSNTERYLLDTLVSATGFEFNMAVGTYQWQVRAENGSSTSGYSRRTLFLDSITDLNKQILVVRAPADDDAFVSKTVRFSWEKISIASHYVIEVRAYESGDLVAGDDALVADTVSFLLPEGKYSWQVRAVNEEGSTAFSIKRTVFVDQTNPVVSVPVSPTGGMSSVGFPIRFTWTRGSDSGSPISDSLFLMNTAGSVISGFPILVNETQYDLDTLAKGNYQWRLNTRDKAGNKSGYSTMATFTVQ